MNLYVEQRREALNAFILIGIVVAAIEVVSMKPDIVRNSFLQILFVVSTAGLYKILISICLFSVNKIKLLLMFYWGNAYIDGLWHYDYVLNGEKYFGVWDVRQDVDGVKVIGTGLSKDFSVRTIGESVSPLIPENGSYFIINSRTDMNDGGGRVFVKSKLIIDRPKKILKGSVSMRGTTEVYGGKNDRQIHQDVKYTKHEDVFTVDDLINKLKSHGNYLS